MKKLLLSITLLICLLYSNKQLGYYNTIEKTTQNKPQKNTGETLSIYEDSLKKIIQKVQNGIDDDEKENANQKFIRILSKTLKQKNSYKFPFDSLNTIQILYSPDKVFRLFNWALEKEDESYRYYAIIQFKNKKEEIIYLNDNSDDIINEEQAELSADNWYGCLYYDIINIRSKGKKFYTLLGWDGNNPFSTKKIIDVMYFSRFNNIQFGAPIFKDDKQRSKKRVVIEYSKQTPISIKYHFKSKRIIFNHLVPQKEELKGVKSYYVPDGSFDAYEYEKGKWWLKKDIDARNSEK